MYFEFFTLLLHEMNEAFNNLIYPRQIPEDPVLGS